MARRGTIGSMSVVGSTWIQILGASPRRRHLTISNPSSGLLFVAAGVPGVPANGSGLVLTNASGFLHLDYRDVGTLICLPIFCLTTLAVVVGWVEVYDDSDLPP